MARMAALAAACFAAVITTAAQAQPQNVSINIRDCTAPAIVFTAKCFSVTTKPAAAVRINLGTAVTIYDAPRLVHTITVNGLTAGASYSGSVVAIPKAGKPRSAPIKKFPVAAPGSTPAVASASGNRLTVNGGTTLLFSAYIASCGNAATINTDQAAGFNLITGHACANSSDSQSTIANLQSALKGTWWHEQEKADEGGLHGLASLLTWNVAGPSPVFPALDPCKGDESKLVAWFGNTMNQISSASGSRVVIPTVWAAKTLMNGTPNCLTPQWMDLFFWGSLAKGARGLVVDTHQPISPVPVPDFSVDSGLWSRIGTELKWASAFGPVAVSGAPNKVHVNAPAAVVSQVWRYGGSWYLDIVNPTLEAVQTTAQFPKSASTQAVGLFGTRGTKLSSGRLAVQLPAKSYAVYRITAK